MATEAEERLNFRRNPHTSFAAASDCRRAFSVNINLPLAADMIGDMERVLRLVPTQTRRDLIREAVARELKRKAQRERLGDGNAAAIAAGKAAKEIRAKADCRAITKYQHR